eukprot:TRINITY_DN5677_c0_g1_i1.p1 TRINITY_DN5677_c0_g1~~TRINITY_DN5677_c0_g1_i1.p1  ORF type:complete len:318 (-),score=53.34 TRINITY_DN5677_c0_g1_i1:45-998(-)
MFWLITLSVLVYLAFWFLRQQLFGAQGKVIVITGCDSGMGLLAAKRFSEMGSKVYASCVTDNGYETLKKMKNVTPFKMDFMKPESIDQATQFLKREASKGIWAIINNAGIVRGLEFELTPIQTYKDVLQVNFIGLITFTQALAPLVRKVRGRIVNTSSAAGSVALPTMSAYTASKFALKGWTDSIRSEMKRWGVTVCLVQPGGMKTAIFTVDTVKALIDDAKLKIDKQVIEDYGESYFQDVIELYKPGKAESLIGNPEWVVDAYVQASLSKFPKDYYWVGYDSYIFFMPLAWSPFATIRDYVLTKITLPSIPKALRT